MKLSHKMISSVSVHFKIYVFLFSFCVLCILQVTSKNYATNKEFYSTLYSHYPDNFIIKKEHFRENVYRKWKILHINSSSQQESKEKTPNRSFILEKKTELLERIDQLNQDNTEDLCHGEKLYEHMAGLYISTKFVETSAQKMSIVAAFLYKLKKRASHLSYMKNNIDELEVLKYALNLFKNDDHIKDTRILIHDRDTGAEILTLSEETSRDERGRANSGASSQSLTSKLVGESQLEQYPWLFNAFNGFNEKYFSPHIQEQTSQDSKSIDADMTGESFWTWPYYNCSNTKSTTSSFKSRPFSIRKDETDEQILKNSFAFGDEDQGESADFVSPTNILKHNFTILTSPVSKWSRSRKHSKNLRLGVNKNLKQLSGKWLISHTSWFPIQLDSRGLKSYGELSFDVDLTSYDINQCAFTDEEEKSLDFNVNPLHYFRDTHKCDRIDATNTCQFWPGRGWQLGSYDCQCMKNHYAYDASLNNTINGLYLESAWINSNKSSDNDNESRIYYDEIVRCQLCPDGCESCVHGKSCFAPISWVFRVILLSISIFCTIGSLALVFVTFTYRKHPVLKSYSPVFHCITLFGCMIMYSEMIALFPILTLKACIAVKWTRHLGFCITYTALYMKLCRVYLTFRVKSAHKIKLTEKSLLQWMSPIMLIMLLYLGAWTISDPPNVSPLYTNQYLKFLQCVYNWWDHALAIGEIIFLAYGIWICWRIRENPDAQYISYSIYNIAFTNLFMASLQEILIRETRLSLFIVPYAGPDAKYFLAFLRIQMSTTVTIGLVFGSKLWTVWREDPRALKEIPSSANGFGGQETLDLAEENQQLKEELLKMATQIERLKCYAMSRNNPHLKQSNINLTSDLDSLTAL